MVDTWDHGRSQKREKKKKSKRQERPPNRQERPPVRRVVSAAVLEPDADASVGVGTRDGRRPVANGRRRRRVRRERHAGRRSHPHPDHALHRGETGDELPLAARAPAWSVIVGRDHAAQVSPAASRPCLACWCSAPCPKAAHGQVQATPASATHWQGRITRGRLRPPAIPPGLGPASPRAWLRVTPPRRDYL